MAEGKKEICSYNYWFPVLKELGDMGVETTLLLDLKKKSEKEEVVEILQSFKANVEDKTKVGKVYSAGLIGASSEGHKEGVEILLAVGGDVNYQNDDGVTPLALASSRNRKEVVEMLLSAGANVNLQNNNGATPLALASSQNHKEIVEILLSAGADVNLPNQGGVAPLMLVCSEGLLEMVELLLSSKADANLQSYRRKATALMVASTNGYKEVVERLLSAGADVNLQNTDGETAQSIAEEEGHQEIVELFKRHESKGNTKE